MEFCYFFLFWVNWSVMLSYCDVNNLWCARLFFSIRHSVFCCYGSAKLDFFMSVCTIAALLCEWCNKLYIETVFCFPVYWNGLFFLLTTVSLLGGSMMKAGLWSRSRWSRMFSAGVGVGFLNLLESESVFQNCWSRESESEHLLQLPTPMIIK